MVSEKKNKPKKISTNALGDGMRERERERKVPEIILECCIFCGLLDPTAISSTHITRELANATEVLQKCCISACQNAWGL